jgi:hypothetical protein
VTLLGDAEIESKAQYKHDFSTIKDKHLSVAIGIDLN